MCEVTDPCDLSEDQSALTGCRDGSEAQNSGLLGEGKASTYTLALYLNVCVWVFYGCLCVCTYVYDMYVWSVCECKCTCVWSGQKTDSGVSHLLPTCLRWDHLAFVCARARDRPGLSLSLPPIVPPECWNHDSC